MDVFEYFVYGYKLNSNKEFHMLTPYKGQINQGEIQIQIFIGNKWHNDLYNENISVDYVENAVILRIGNMVEYRINYRDNQIVVYSTDFVWIESTFLNLPFALFFAQKGMILLHASSLVIGNFIVPFCAQKGMGKTTVSMGLSRFYDFYSDDTLLLKKENHNVFGYYGTNHVKLTKDSYDCLVADGNFVMRDKTVQGKAYVKTRENIERELGQVENLFFLQRGGDTVSLKKIANKFSRKIMLHSNICGTGTLGYEYCKVIERMDLFDFILEHFCFFKINVRDDKAQLEMTLLELKEVIHDNMSMFSDREECHECQ